MVEIVIVPAADLSPNVLSDQDIANGTIGLEHWINGVIAPAYSQGKYNVHAIGRGQPVPAGTDHRWLIWLHANSDQPGAAGYHTADNGCPSAKIFVVDVQAAGMSWTAVVSHEVAEIMVNRWCNAAVLGPSGFYWQEACDPVEAFGQRFGYDNGARSVQVSDFVLPSYWRQGSPGPWSAFHNAPGPLQPAAQGRQEVFGISTNTVQQGAHITSILPPPLT